jgi:hypothetical protein
MSDVVRQLADTLVLGALLDEVRGRFGTYELLAHWKQGEFHHDVVLRVRENAGSPGEELPGDVVVVATNCNGGVKEVLCFDVVPERSALWHWRCSDAPDFTGTLPPLRGRAVTAHWFDPCDLLAADARSELREEFRERQPGGGWQLTSSACGRSRS